MIKRKWELRYYTCGLDSGDLAVAEREWMVGILGSEGRVFSALDLECLERDLGRSFWMEEADMVPKKLDLVVFVLCLLCPIVLWEREREREREREVFGGRENEGKWKPLWNTEMSEGWVEFGYIVFGLNGPQLVFS